MSEANSELIFETLKFKETDNEVVVTFLNIYNFSIQKNDLLKIGNFSVKSNALVFECSQNSAERKFNDLLIRGFQNLTNRVTGKKTLYVHKNSGIPLIGNISFGLIDRGSNIVEIRPISGCNIKCVYCSISDDSRVRDVVVEAEYLAEEYKKLVEFKNVKVEAHIASQGEPTLYADLVKLVKLLREISQTGIISIDTNGTLLNEHFVDNLVNSGLTRFNFSLNAMSQEKASEIANAGYNLKRVLDIMKHISTKCELIVAPVWVPEVNDDEMSYIIEFVKSLKNEIFEPKVCIQKYQYYSLGRNPSKEISWEEFYEKLKKLEQKHNVKLIISESDFKIEKSNTLQKPFKKGNVIKARIVSEGRLPNEKLAVANERVISVYGNSVKEVVNVRIKRSKHNIFVGELS